MERQTRWTTALDGWRSRLRPDQVITDAARIAPYRLNVTEYSPREVPAVLLPESVADAAWIVKVAAQSGVPLYPVSTGRNWGVGSKLPVRDGAAIVDLSRMRAIRRVDAAARVAVVEPGVTQAALADRLASDGVALRVNVTGSGGNTSVLGNALERGVGVLGQRSADVRGLEVLLGTGDVVRTGLWHLAAERDDFAYHYPEGLGPDLTGLLMQSSFGIATAMAVRLYPAQPVTLALAACGDSTLPAVIDGLGALRAEGVLRDRIEIDRSDDPRVAALARARSGEVPRWLVWLALQGSERIRTATYDELVDRIGGSCVRLDRFDSVDDAVAQGADRETVQARFNLIQGIPSDFSIRAMARAHGVDATAAAALDLDEHPEIPGFVAVLPAVPLSGAVVRRVVDCIDATARQHDIAVYQSFNTVSDAALEGYIRASFDRRDAAAVARAHRWCAAAHVALRDIGVFPMRVNVEQMEQALACDGDPFWRVIGLIDRALDPAGIIAPGRYAPRR